MVSIHTRSHQLNYDGHKTAHRGCQTTPRYLLKYQRIFLPPSLLACSSRVTAWYIHRDVLRCRACRQSISLAKGLVDYVTDMFLHNLEVAAWWRLMDAVLQYLSLQNVDDQCTVGRQPNELVLAKTGKWKAPPCMFIHGHKSHSFWSFW